MTAFDEFDGTAALAALTTSLSMAFAEFLVGSFDALDLLGFFLAVPGGGDFGTGIGFMASALTFGVAFCTLRRLFSPRTGVRVTNTHPT